jgi:hypothetical protein
MKQAIAAKRPRGPGRPFVKGQSGNPKGRTPLAAEVRAAARQYTMEAIERLVHWMRSDQSPSASIAAADKLLDRGWGKAAQPLGGSDDLPPIHVQDPVTDEMRLRALTLLLAKVKAARPSISA